MLDNSIHDLDRGKIAIFIDGSNLLYGARAAHVEIDYLKLRDVLAEGGHLSYAYFYTGVDPKDERQLGFLCRMRCGGFRVVTKDLRKFEDGHRKANMDVEIGIDMVTLAHRYDTAVLVSGDEDFLYAVRTVINLGGRVEVASFRPITSGKLMKLADKFIDLCEFVDRFRKEKGAA